MRKILSVVLALAIMMTVVSSMAFASTNEISIDSSNIKIYASHGEKAYLSPNTDGEYEFTKAGYSRRVEVHNFFGTELENQARYLKVSFDFTPKTTGANLKAYPLTRGSSDSNFGYMSSLQMNYLATPAVTSSLAFPGTGLTEKVEVSYLTDVETNDVYIFINDILVGAFIDTEATNAGFEIVGAVFYYYKNSTTATATISNLQAVAYKAGATFDEMGLKIGYAERNQSAGTLNYVRGTYFDGLVMENTKLSGNTTDGYEGSLQSKVGFYVAGYDANDNLVWVALQPNVDKWDYADTLTGVPSSATKFKTFVLNTDTLRPYTLQATVEVK